MNPKPPLKRITYPALYHRDGILWMDAPRPRRWHRCKPWTKGWATPRDYVERCACGAIRLDSWGPWLEKNDRRR